MNKNASKRRLSSIGSIPISPSAIHQCALRNCFTIYATERNLLPYWRFFPEIDCPLRRDAT